MGSLGNYTYYIGLLGISYLPILHTINLSLYKQPDIFTPTNVTPSPVIALVKPVTTTILPTTITAIANTANVIYNVAKPSPVIIPKEITAIAIITAVMLCLLILVLRIYKNRKSGAAKEKEDDMTEGLKEKGIIEEDKTHNIDGQMHSGDQQENSLQSES